MSTNRINIALVGDGRELSDMLAGLATRSRLLRLKISAVIDLGTDPNSPAREHAASIGIPLISANISDLNDLSELGLVIMASPSAADLADLRAKIPRELPVMGPESHDLIAGLHVQLIER